MRTFEYIEPTSVEDSTPVFLRKTEEEILTEYWNYWKEKMARCCSNKNAITKENCIEDWCVIHWATEVKDGL